MELSSVNLTVNIKLKAASAGQRGRGREQPLRLVTQITGRIPIPFHISYFCVLPFQFFHFRLYINVFDAFAEASVEFELFACCT